MILEILEKVNAPKILLINKCDLLEEGEIEPIKRTYIGLNTFDYIIPISALNDENIGKYIETVKEILPEGPLYYPSDMITDKNERFIVSEIIREKALKPLEKMLELGA